MKSRFGFLTNKLQRETLKKKSNAAFRALQFMQSCVTTFAFTKLSLFSRKETNMKGKKK